MCYSRTVFFYGLFVTTSSLAFAAVAYEKTQGPRDFIDLVRNRRANGTLGVDERGCKLVQNLPVELWDQVKAALIEQAVEDAELKEVRDLRCAECEHAVECTSCAENQGYYIWRYWELPPCDQCWENIIDSGEYEPLDVHNDVIKTFLAAFGFVRPLDTNWRDVEGAVDYESLTAISLPLHGQDDRAHFPRLSTESPHGQTGPESDTIIFPPSIFQLPSNANFRFERLIAQWHLKVDFRAPVKQVLPPPIVHDTSQETSTAPSDSATMGPNKEKERAKSEDDDAMSRKPQWRMWNAVGACD